MAFAGVTSKLYEMVEVKTNSLLLKLVDEKVITTREREHVEVSG